MPDQNGNLHQTIFEDQGSVRRRGVRNLIRASAPAAGRALLGDKKEPTTAAAIINELQAAKIGLTNGVAQTEDNDPNNLLGRPNGYASRASADLPGGDKMGEKYSVDLL